MDIDPAQLRLGSGVLIDVFLLSVMDTNERLDRFDHALRIAYKVPVGVLWP